MGINAPKGKLRVFLTRFSEKRGGRVKYVGDYYPREILENPNKFFESFIQIYDEKGTITDVIIPSGTEIVSHF